MPADAPRALSAEQEAAIAYIREHGGKPYERLANGPDSFDCTGLAQHVIRTLFSQDVPHITVPQGRMDIATAREHVASVMAPLGWRLVLPGERRLRHGNLCVMGSSDQPSHIGVFLAVPPGPGGVIHAWETYDATLKPTGKVCFHTVPHLEWMGFTRFRWFTRASPDGAGDPHPSTAEADPAG